MRNILIALAALMLAIGATSAAQDATVRVIIQSWPGFGFAFAGMEKGFFKRLHLEQTILDDANARSPAFQSGKFDALMVATSDLPALAAQGVLGNAKVVAVTDESHGGDGVLARSDIRTPLELRGKRIAVVRATSAHAVLARVLEAAGL